MLYKSVSNIFQFQNVCCYLSNNDHLSNNGYSSDNGYLSNNRYISNNGCLSSNGYLSNYGELYIIFLVKYRIIPVIPYLVYIFEYYV